MIIQPGDPWSRFFCPQELEHNVFLRASRADVSDEEMGKLRRGRWAAGRRIRYCLLVFFYVFCVFDLFVNRYRKYVFKRSI